MSIAEDEAERVYPTRYRDGTHVKEKLHRRTSPTPCCSAGSLMGRCGHERR